MFFLTLLTVLLQPIHATQPVQTNLVLSEEAMHLSLKCNPSQLPVELGLVAQVPAKEVKTHRAQQKPVEVVKAEPASEQKKEAPQEAIGIIRIINKIHETEEIINKIVEFDQDSNVKGVLLIVDCGGGTIGSSEILFREVKELSCQKPVVTLVINTCCSGAYWIAMASNWIVAQSSSTIGAIGVKFAIEKCKNFKQTDQGHSADLDITVICAGKFKGASDERTAPMNDEERALMQAYVDQQYEIFTSFVAQARNLSLEKVSEWAEGRNFTGAQALKLGLIDQIGGYSDAVKKLKQLIRDRNIVITQKLTFVE